MVFRYSGRSILFSTTYEYTLSHVALAAVSTPCTTPSLRSASTAPEREVLLCWSAAPVRRDSFRVKKRNRGGGFDYLFRPRAAGVARSLQLPKKTCPD